MPGYRQRDVSDCGACCFAFVAARFGKKLPIPVVRRVAGTGPQGTTALGLVETAKNFGFSAKCVRGPVEALPSVPLPVIAHCQIDQRLLHYVVLVEWSRKRARVMDPALGRVETWSHEKFRAMWTGILILLAPADDFQPGNHTCSPWRRLWTLVRPHHAILCQAFLGAVVTTVLGLSMSIYVQQLMDHVLPGADRPLLNLLGLAMLAVLGFKLVLGWFHSLLSLRLAQRIDAMLILGYYRHLLRLPQAFFDTMRVGEITSRAGDAIRIRHFLNKSLVELMLHPLILGFSLAAMFFYSWQLAVLSLALIPANALIYAVVNRLNREYQRRIMERAADLDAQLVESLNVQPVLRRFRLEHHAIARTEVRLVRLLKTGWRATLGAVASDTTATFVSQTYLIGLLWLGASLVIEAGLTAGQLMSCYTIATYLTGPILGLITLNSSIQEALIATDRLFEVMDLEAEKDQGRIEFTRRHAGEVRFEAVTFRHAGRLPVLHGVTLAARPAQITAVAGESGCGKSTLLALLQRLYHPETGRVLVGGHDIQYYELDSLRRHLAVVPQQTHLLSGTVLENLAPGESEPEMERVLRLCQEVGALEFIEKLPQGFCAYLNENGANLSGGQRQRLALVRALYQDAPILLLDEPTSALDQAGEARVVALLREQREQGRTVIVATHAPALLACADVVVWLSEGRVVQAEDRVLCRDARSPLRAAELAV